ncbi:Golgi integral membrane protein 4-like [Euwallacea fornicatus]|uniref:Golgi integral membrane protein 4-like n=1 Tax=Euwallacea fornicatus TaxID=995702 RepID=UPI00338E98EE
MASMGLSSSSTRVIRGPKTKLFLYLCAVIVIVGLIACYNSSLSQLEEASKANVLCRQQQENLSTQLQVISDYKLKLEKGLKSEKAEHQQNKNEWEMKVNEEKNRGQKLTKDALLKYNSLNQHYKLLQSQFDDFKEDSGGTQKKQLEEINSLQSKLKEIEEELKKVKASKENIKSQFTELELENIELKKDLQKASETESQRTIKLYSEEYRILSEKYNNLRKKCGETVKDSPIKSLKGETIKPSEKAALNLPDLKMAENPSSSTKAGPKVSSAALNGALPLHQPSVTPETVKKEMNLKPPQGVVEPPENRENQNEQPQLVDLKKPEKADDPDKDNAAQEEFDGPFNNMELGFADEGVKQNLNGDQRNQVNVDSKKHDEQDYKDLQREEEGGDDDIDDYEQARGEAAVRN